MALYRVHAPQVLYFRVETRDASQANLLANPISVGLILHEPDGTVGPALTLAPAGIGIWALNWELPAGSAPGIWTSYLTITDPVGESDSRSVSFEVLSPET